MVDAFLRLYLGWLFGQESGIDFDEVGCHNDLRAHIFWASIQHRLPEWTEELLGVAYACFDDGPYLAAEHFCSNIRVSEN